MPKPSADAAVYLSLPITYIKMQEGNERRSQVYCYLSCSGGHTFDFRPLTGNQA